MKPKCVLVASLLLALWVGATASAEDAPRSYQVTIDQAVAEFEAGHYPEARALFMRAHEIAPNARTLRALGMVEFELRQYRESSEHLQQALASKVKPLDAALRADTEQLLGRAQSFLATVHLQVTPADSVLMVDGQPTALSGDPLLLSMGDHTLELSAPGRKSERRTLHLAGREEQRLSIALAPEELSTAPAESTPLRKNKWLWTGVGIVVVGLAVGLGVGLRGEDKRVHEQAYGGDSGEVLVGP